MNHSTTACHYLWKSLVKEYVRRLQRAQLLIGLFCFQGKVSELGAQNIVVVF